MNELIITLIVIAIIAVIAGLLFWAYKKVVVPKINNYNELLQSNKVTVSIFVVDKVKDKLENQNVPKVLIDQIPKMLRNKKFCMVKAKIGSQFQTLLIDDKLFVKIPTKKMVKVDLAGMYIICIK